MFAKTNSYLLKKVNINLRFNFTVGRQLARLRSMKNIALIVAGGSGTRFGSGLPKQYQKLGTKTVLAQTVEAFKKHPQIDGVLVVINKEHEHFFDLDVPYCFGGNERQDSVRLGLVDLIKQNPKNVLIHDAARPFVSAKVISNVIEGLQAHDSAIPVVGIKDSVRIDGAAIDRSKLQIIQTPQGFDFKKIFHAHQHHSSHWQKLTDDAQVFEAAGQELNFVEGDEMNKKITTASDIARQQDFCTGNGFDVHEFEAGDGVILCGVKIPHNKKLKGHSDADAGLHALTDAMLGAIGEGDIGEHFPPSEPKWKGADSAIFIEHTLKLLAEKNALISNIDITIIAEEPKITPHKKAMRARLAALLNIEEQRINVKATTTEGLGFTGRREGIAVQAVATISILR